MRLDRHVRDFQAAGREAFKVLNQNAIYFMIAKPRIYTRQTLDFPKRTE
jgi:hypothetical protein